MSIQEWGNALKAQIHDPLDYPLFDEIIGCLNANFLRSAYIMSWVGISENLKNKILQSSNLGDAAATTALAAIGEAENNKKSVDKIILEKAVGLNLVDATDKATLEYLWGQRSIFAHPYQLAPNLDETKFIINKLVEICVAKPLLYKKGFLDEMIRNLVDKPFFLPNNEVEILKYYSGVLPRITHDLHPYLFKNLLAELGGIENNETKKDIQHKLKLFLTKLLAESALRLDDPNWTLEAKTVRYPFTVLFGCATTQTWIKFPARIKQLLVDYALAEVDETKRYQIKCTFFELVGSGILEPDYRTRYFAFLDNIQFSYAINFYADKPQMLTRILAGMDTGNYDKQNPIVDFIKSENGRRLLDGLDGTGQAAIGASLTYAARGNNWNAIGYFDALPGQTNLPAGFVDGVLAGTLFNRQNGFHIDLSRFQTGLKTLEKLPPQEALDLLDGLKARVAEVGTASTHHLEDAQIDAAKLAFQNLQIEIRDKAEEVLEELRPFKYVWPEL